MFHLAAYAATVDNTTDTDVTAVTDDILTIQNSHFILGRQMNLFGVAAMSATLSRAKIASASMRQIASPFIRPVIAAATPGNNPNVMILDNYPFSIPPFEEIQMLCTSGVAMTEPFAGLIWLGDQIDPIGPGNVIPLRWTSTTAAVSNAWTSITITFADTLPSGLYSIVWSECQSTNARAHRWIISNQMWRPGNLSYTSLSQRSPYAWQLGQLGRWGSFRSNDLPRCQVLVNGTDNSHEGYLWVQRTGNLAA